MTILSEGNQSSSGGLVPYRCKYCSPPIKVETAVCGSDTPILNSQGGLHELVQCSTMKNAACWQQAQSAHKQQGDREEMVTFIPNARLQTVLPLPSALVLWQCTWRFKQDECLACALTEHCGHFSQPCTAQSMCWRCVTLQKCSALAERGNIMSFPAATLANPWETFPLKYFY